MSIEFSYCYNVMYEAKDAVALYYTCVKTALRRTGRSNRNGDGIRPSADFLSKIRGMEMNDAHRISSYNL